jgi:hypothetical protein
MERLYNIIILAILTFASSYSNSAVLNVFDDRAIFNASLSDSTTETFNSFASDQSFNGVNVDVGDFTLSAENVSTRNLIDVLPYIGTVGDINGTPLLNYFLDNTSATIVFDTAITAIGFDISDFGNVGNVSSLTVLDVTFDQTNITGSSQFFGFTSDTAFTTLTFASTINDGFSIDDITYGNVSRVSAPAILSLYFVAFACLFFGRRRFD